jgi:hypothetical protein
LQHCDVTGSRNGEVAGRCMLDCGSTGGYLKHSELDGAGRLPRAARQLMGCHMNDVETSNSEPRVIQTSAPDTVSYRSPVRATRTAGIGAVAVGALAVGATAIGALAIGRLTVGALRLKRGRIRSLMVDDLEVRRLHIRELVVDSRVSG